MVLSSLRPTPNIPDGGTALTSAITFADLASAICCSLITSVPALAAQKIISASGKYDEFNSSVEPSAGITSTPNLFLYSSDFFLHFLYHHNQ